MLRLLLPLLLCTLPAVHAQTTPPAPRPDAVQARYDSAYVAWEDGDYVSALTSFERLLAGADAARFHAPIALVTGELYRSVQVAPDGGRLRWSDDGRLAAYTAGRTTHVVDVAGGTIRPVAQVSGGGLAFAPDGSRVAYFHVPETPAVMGARARADSLLRAHAGAAYQRQLQEVARIEQEAAHAVVRNLRTGREQRLRTDGLAGRTLAFSSDGQGLFLLAAPRGEPGRTDLYAVAPDVAPRAITEGLGTKQNLIVVPGGRFVVFTVGPATVAVRDLQTGQTRDFEGEAPAVSADGSTLAFVTRSGTGAATEYTLHTVVLGSAEAPTVARRSPRPLATPALSPDGQRVAFAMQPRDDWDLYVVGRDGSGEVRLTREIQHDRFPRWLDGGRVLAMKGEPRHTRAYLYDAATGAGHRLHHNNTVRTVAPEYEWAPSPDGTKLLIVADRDGDTISPERAVTLLDLSREVTVEDVRARVQAMLAAERDLSARSRGMFGGIADPADSVPAATGEVSTARIYGHARDLYAFDSKFITQPGNALAIEYLAAQLRAMGYEPALQWFEPRPGVRTANVIATLRGTAHPALIYVISSHFDSVEAGPGADDNTSGTTALLEAARVLAGRPQAATVQFAFFTGEEAGLLGSREFVRRAVAAGDRIVGALNNDMVGWMNDHRLDNTIRYSNPGIRDVQHAAAFTFTDLITYDAKYYRNTDAHAYYEVYGDIVGGIGSYPILGNPHYHQPHDILETVSHQLVAEVSKTTIATIMLLASSPARLSGLTLTPRSGGVDVAWTPAVESGVRSYVVAYGPAADPMRQTLTVNEPRVRLDGAGPGTVVSVKAVGANGRQSWDWARGTVGR
jgi:Tol biopolymer transport system component